jgi:hypothetical protein
VIIFQKNCDSKSQPHSAGRLFVESFFSSQRNPRPGLSLKCGFSYWNDDDHSLNNARVWWICIGSDDSDARQIRMAVGRMVFRRSSRDRCCWLWRQLFKSCDQRLWFSDVCGEPNRDFESDHPVWRPKLEPVPVYRPFRQWDHWGEVNSCRDNRTTDHLYDDKAHKLKRLGFNCIQCVS